MNEATCSRCGGDLVPGAGFCRQCGTPVAAGSESSEQPTARLAQAGDRSSTRPLDARPTNSGVQNSLIDSSAPSSEARAGNGRLKLVVAVLLVATLLGLGSLVRSLIKSRKLPATISTISRTLVYPGGRVILDLSNDGVGSVLQMSTRDPLDKVQSWYVVNLQPTKILQVTSGTVILRKDNVTATLVAEHDTTNIVIKQSVP